MVTDQTKGEVWRGTERNGPAIGLTFHETEHKQGEMSKRKIPARAFLCHEQLCLPERTRTLRERGECGR
jgi:hypothetical protein